MSDSELSDAPSIEIPPDSEIEATLQREVKTAAKGPLEDYTVSKIRKAAENSLGLSEGFLKGDEKWKARSKSIIEKQVEIESAAASQASVSQPKKKPSTKSASEPKKPAKRISPNENRRASKKQKIESDGESSSLSSAQVTDEDFGESKKPVKGKKDTKKASAPKAKATPKPKSKPETKAKAKAKAADSEDDAEEIDSDGIAAKDDESGSEMSVVLDEAPAKKPRSKGKSSDVAIKKSAASNPKSKPSTEGSPDEEEIKKLKNWLAKCGIRKVWGKELKPLETDKAKIKYLKQLLADVGMGGRYSNEKAAQIKEARELAADIEAVQEGNERWGKNEGEDENEDGDKSRGGRRLVRGAKNYAFLSSDGEETD